MFSNKAYDVLKFIALVVLPALAVLYMGLGQIWEWPETEKVAGSIVLVDTFLGALLQISTKKYNNDPNALDGYLYSNTVDEDTGLPDLKLMVTTPPDELLNGKRARLKIGPPPG